MNDNWQSIETAPRDGTPIRARIYIYGTPGTFRAKYVHGCWRHLNGIDILRPAPSEWQPLPAPPTDGRAAEAEKDRERLDWLEEATAPNKHPVGEIMVRSGKPCETINLRLCFGKSTLRAAIDEARKRV